MSQLELSESVPMKGAGPGSEGDDFEPKCTVWKARLRDCGCAHPIESPKSLRPIENLHTHILA